MESHGIATLAELVVYAVVGLFATNAIPHFVRGITGRRHMTPFGSDSSAVLNVLWGSANAAVAGVALAVGLASYWSSENPRLPWE